MPAMLPMLGEDESAMHDIGQDQDYLQGLDFPNLEHDQAIEEI